MNELTKRESEMPQADPLTKPNFKVVRRLVNKQGNSIGIATPLQRVREGKALDYIKEQQRTFERSGHNREFDYYWAANSESPGCASEFVTRWTIEKV